MTNALFALGLAHIAGADLVGASRGLAEFGGVRRRFEMHVGANGGILVNDYAHHPAEIRAVLLAAKKRFPGQRLLAVFQPHQFQRTLCLLPEFGEALAGAGHALVVDIYGARESAEMQASVSANDLVTSIRQSGGSAAAAGPVAGLADVVLRERRAGDVVLVLGAGDIDRAVGGIVSGL
jgi:UDP-N-acetylmuramate--alanine ligase